MSVLNAAISACRYIVMAIYLLFNFVVHYVLLCVYFKADHVYISLNWPGLEFVCYVWPEVLCYGGRRWVGLPTSRARARVRRLTPTDRCPRDLNHEPLDLKSSILIGETGRV